MFRTVLLPLVLVFGVVFSQSSAHAQPTIDNPTGGFDITATNQNYGAQFTADVANLYYSMIFEYEVTPGVWSQLGSNGVYVTTTGSMNLNVQLGTLGPGTYYNGRVKLIKMTGKPPYPTVTVTGHFRGAP